MFYLSGHFLPLPRECKLQEWGFLFWSVLFTAVSQCLTQYLRKSRQVNKYFLSKFKVSISLPLEDKIRITNNHLNKKDNNILFQT